MTMHAPIRSSVAVAALFMMSVLATPFAFADYQDFKPVRHGRFMWHQPVQMNTAPIATQTVGQPKHEVKYEKGSAGTYVRHTRTVSKLYAGSPQMSSQEPQYAASRHRVSNDFKRPFG